MKFLEWLEEGMSYKKGDKIPAKDYLHKQDYKKDYFVVVDRKESKPKEDQYMMYIVTNSGSVKHNLGSHSQLVKNFKDNVITNMMEEIV